MLLLAKIGAALISVGLFALPFVYWLGPAIGLFGTGLTVVGLVLMFWSRYKAASAAGIGKAKFDRDGTAEPPDVGLPGSAADARKRHTSL